MAAQTSPRGRQLGRSRRSVVHIHFAAAEPVEERTNNKCNRTTTRGVQTTDQTQTVLPSAETAAMLFWALLASGQINMRKVDGWQTLAIRTIDHPIDLAA